MPKAKETLIDLIEKPPDSQTRRLTEVKHALKYGSFSRGRLYQLINDGRIKAYKDGRKTMVDLNSIDTYRNGLPAFIGSAERKRRRK